MMIAMEFVDLIGVFVDFYEPSCLIDDAWLTEFHQLLSISQRYFLFEFITDDTPLVRRSFDGNESLVITNTDTYRLTTSFADAYH